MTRSPPGSWYRYVRDMCNNECGLRYQFEGIRYHGGEITRRTLFAKGTRVLIAISIYIRPNSILNGRT